MLHAVLEQARPRGDLPAFHFLIVASHYGDAGAGDGDDAPTGQVVLELADQRLLPHGHLREAADEATGPGAKTKVETLRFATHVIDQTTSITRRLFGFDGYVWSDADRDRWVLSARAQGKGIAVAENLKKKARRLPDR